ncbi:hypothetical protein EGW08_011125 [Elysia chlorotica]|uniref:C-type lectin domain-containing protein n=1 Tax=Elysia chlorotica TaxID=188477 RepID=A0A433THX9_ELYCH|nr:hypothetical protein EGW08_011125 [Elysia chlorotica]
MCVHRAILLLALGMMSATVADPILDTNKAIKLSYVSNEHCLTITCNFEQTSSSLTQVGKLEIAITPLIGDGIFNPLTAIETSSQGQKLYNSLSESDLDLSGEIGESGNTESHLKLDWKTVTSGYCLIYKCSATGVDAQGNEVELFRSIKVKGRGGESCAVKPSFNEILNNLLTDSYTCSSTVERARHGLIQHRIDSLRGTVDGLAQLETSVDQNTQQIALLNSEISLFDSISSLTVVNTNSLTDAENQVSLLATKLTNDESETENLLNDLEARVNQASQQAILQYKLAKQVDSGNSISPVYEGRIYALATSTTNFTLVSANDMCKLYGGYLVELDGGSGEQSAVGNFLLSAGVTSAFTGGNDVDSESTFRYINSGTLFVNEMWAQFEPALAGRGAADDCVTIGQDGTLSEEECSGAGKYVCEIPLEFDF